MAIGAGTALSIGGSILGAMGNKKQGATNATMSTFDSLPQEVKDIWMKSYIPAVQTQFDKPYEAVPMKRYNEAPSSPFYSQGMAELQAYSDMKGGLFTPYGKAAGGDKAAEEAAAQEAMKKEMENLRLEMMGRDWAGQNARGTNYSNARLSGMGSNMGNEDYKLLGAMAKYGMTPRDAVPGAKLDQDAYKAALQSIDKTALSPNLAKYIAGLK